MNTERLCVSLLASVCHLFLSLPLSRNHSQVSEALGPDIAGIAVGRHCLTFHLKILIVSKSSCYVYASTGAGLYNLMQHKMSSFVLNIYKECQYRCMGYSAVKSIQWSGNGK